MTRRPAVRVLLAAAVLAAVAPGGSRAQEGPAKGPAEIINRANQGAAEEEMREAGQAGDEASEDSAPPESGGAGDDPHGGVSRAALQRMMGRSEPLAKAQPSAEVPARTVRVRVVDGAGEPVAGQAVRLGIMEARGSRSSQSEPTDASGTAVFDGLTTGQDVSYRVSVPHEGATYGAEPFRLPPERGYDVRIRRLPVTRDPRAILQFMGQSILEIRNERLHVTQHAQLTNMAESTYVLPDEGLEVRLPAGFTGFQSQETMTDQRVEATETGLRLHGSIPPGQVSLAWAFDLPLEGSAVDFEFPMPFRTYTYRVMAEAAPGLELEVRQMPEPTLRETRTGEFLFTETRRAPEDPPLEYVTVHVGGIPGPGPWRWIAVGGSVAFLLAGVFLAMRGGRRVESEAQAREDRKKQLLAEAVELEQMFAKHEIGPQYHRRRMDGVLERLAALLKQEDHDRRTQPERPMPDNRASTS